MLVAALTGAEVIAARRRGKLLLLDTDDAVLGLRFGMTGRLVVDGLAAIDELEYGSRRDDPAWDRLALAFDGGGTLRVNDPRRLGGIELDPDERTLGVDALAVTERQLAAALAGSHAPLKARLLDQARVAGVGNLLADEALWRAGPRPGPAGCRPVARRGEAAPPGAPADAQGAGGAGRFAPRRPAGRPPPGWALSEGRDAARAAHDRRPYDVLLPLSPALTRPRLGRRAPRERLDRHANRPPTRRRGPRGGRRRRGGGRTGAGADRRQTTAPRRPPPSSRSSARPRRRRP